MGVPCYIDDCPNEATLILDSYPDQVQLCDKHKSYATAYDYTSAGVPVPWNVR
jgi:hypothetical protein